MIKSIAIFGAGPIGMGVAQIALAAGYKVGLVETDKAKLALLSTQMAEGMTRLLPKDSSSSSKWESRFALSDKLEIAKDADLVIEAIWESEEAKRDLYRQLSGVIRDDALLATSSSSISITRLGASSGRASQFCGLHFMNPPQAIPLVELVRGLATGEAAYKACHEFIESLGKTVAESEDFPGFIVNRVLVPMINEAIYALYEGVGQVTAIDKALSLGARHPMGPLELADYIGLDRVLALLLALQNDLSDPKYRPCPLLMKYVESGWLGRKTGRGFYDYETDPPQPTR